MPISYHSINPYLRVAMHSVLPRGTEIKRRIIFDYELIYLESGSLRFCYDDTEYFCTAGQFLFIHPGIPHSFHIPEEDLSQPHVHFDLVYTSKSRETPVSFKDICDLSQEERALIQDDLLKQEIPSPFVTFSDPERAKQLLFSLISQTLSPLEEKSILLQLTDQLITDNFSGCCSPEEPHHNIARQLKDYMDAGQGLSSQLEELEKQFSYSKYYLERQFKKHYGMGLIAYRNKKRMELAKEYLKNDSISAVAEQLGFSSIYVFSRAFKQFSGLSPSAFQKNQQNKPTVG